MASMEPSAAATRFRQLHGPEDRPLLLCNIWDAGSARIVEAAGYPALATGSAGVAFSLGYADGQKIPFQEMMDAVARIVRAVDVPVSADIEAGYGDVAATARGLIDAGAAGMNLEDLEDGKLVPLDQQVERVRQARDSGLVVNARTDIYLAGIGDAGSRFDRTVERLRAFAAAGADSVFVPGVRDEATIAALVRSVDVPLNVLATTGSPTVTRLRELGVGRISVGSGPMRATMALTRRIALELRNTGDWESFTKDTLSYADANALFQR